ncbi:amidohydrolase family protein [Mycobacterium sp. NPDC006124]|uniref:amidohydrolase family protein n=1 Tax=Mycobacterium sp. NPDC006124 TaxID=3156729 RepID=UPI0033B49C73
MRIITVEEHFHHPQSVAQVLELSGPGPVTPDAGFGEFLGDFMPDRESAESLAGKRLAHMDEVGIDVQVVSHGANSPGNLAHPDAVQLCRTVNDELARQISEHPTRFRGFATLPLYEPATAADELRRCVEELGFVGALTHGSIEGAFLDHPRFEPVLAAAEAVGRPIYVHPGMPGRAISTPYYAGEWPAAVQFLFAGPAFGWHAEAGIHVIRLILSGALDRHPNLTLLSGHWGELVAGWLDRLDEVVGWADHLDRAPSAYYREQVWATPSGMFSQNQLNFIVAEIGADRIIHSEDYPYVVRDDVSTFLERADLTDGQRAAIAHGNAEKLLGMSGQ